MCAWGSALALFLGHDGILFWCYTDWLFVGRCYTSRHADEEPEDLSDREPRHAGQARCPMREAGNDEAAGIARGSQGAGEG